MSLPLSRPADAGLDLRRLAVADALVAKGCEDGIYPSAVLLIARHGKIAHQSAVGVLKPGGPKTQVDTIFDLASLTKPHVALGLLTLLEEGKLALTQEIQAFLPEAKGTAVGPLTLKLLATHTSGLPAWKPLYKSGIDGPKVLPDAHDRILGEILATPLHHPPGTKYMYSDLGYMLIGEIVSRVGGMALDLYLHSRIFAPLGMKDTGYRPAPTLRDRIAPTSNSALQGKKLVHGEVHDENALVFGGVSGHAGLFGTASDLAIPASALATNGEVKGHRVLGVPTLRLVRSNQTDPAVGGHSIGWFTPPNGMLPRGDIFGDSAFGHTGFTGTMILIDPSVELAVILLTNRVVNPTDNGGIIRIRRLVANIVASAIVR
jgi:CubicO group peptidase (beta-lactamase class C family)